ncbi:unnamed protein product [Zymoseptoria tritici ST99CH_3D1]|uniref:Pectate lyase superfamily protein domain-containing protein n=2 Tax=Zymoseptoria tritici TaxID=1047171 RepID=A0A1X7RYC3_ZYMT9|nr:unnamed protein product [Zymoseptoria tritici ST99CH_3D7]SMR55207.1 unnamed protein product [Zymoseptoria tritici ST99CH_1E4]SMR57581.1 unnamed protein product [Zymoseptoria tritici ST99CH_3D1]
MASPLHLALLALIFATQADGRRGGGGGTGGSGGDGDGGEGGAGGGGDALIDYTKDCKAAQAAQTQDLYLMPGSYYSGPLTITHKVDFNSAAADTSSATTTSRRSSMSMTPYSLSALSVTEMIQQMSSGAFKLILMCSLCRAMQGELVRIRSASYGQEERERKGLRFYYPYLSGDESALAVPWNESSRQYWNTSLSPTTLSVPNGTVPVDSWIISATYVRYPDAIPPGRYDTYQPYYPHNLVTLSDICYSERDNGAYPGDIEQPSSSP